MLNPKTTIKVNAIVAAIFQNEKEVQAIQLALNNTVCETFVSEMVNELGGYAKMRAVENAEKNWINFSEYFKKAVYEKFGTEIKATKDYLEKSKTGKLK